MKPQTILLLLSFVTLSVTAFSQAGISVYPSRLHYITGAGESQTQTITVNNPSDKPIDVGVSIGDWKYNEDGQNQTFEAGTLPTSCAKWIKILPGSFFSLQPGESRKLNVVFDVPQGDTSLFTHTAMVYLTQMNPGEVRTQSGAAINVSVRMGVKVYHAFAENNTDLDVMNFVQKKDSISQQLKLTVANTSKMWVDGKMYVELLNTHTGEKTKIENITFYTLPGDTRNIPVILPSDLKKDAYVATAFIQYGAKYANLKVAELEFNY